MFLQLKPETHDKKEHFHVLHPLFLFYSRHNLPNTTILTFHASSIVLYGFLRMRGFEGAI